MQYISVTMDCINTISLNVVQYTKYTKYTNYTIFKDIYLLENIEMVDNVICTFIMGIQVVILLMSILYIYIYYKNSCIY